ncbi:hypothetical protein KY329_02170 [Candidatus Woesearchaeota archaeon]|nr:hypothetical protein [Candidatus Woesearchaeota archaeon]
MAKTKKKTAKKTAKKAVKKAPKRTITVCVKRKILGKAPEEKCFILQDGRKLETVYHLIDELETMPEQVFQDHVNEFKNDFANWVEHVFEDKSLAEEMREAQTRMELQLALLKEIVRELKKHAK